MTRLGRNVTRYSGDGSLYDTDPSVSGSAQNGDGVRDSDALSESSSGEEQSLAESPRRRPITSRTRSTRSNRSAQAHSDHSSKRSFLVPTSALMRHIGSGATVNSVQSSEPSTSVNEVNLAISTSVLRDSAGGELCAVSDDSAPELMHSQYQPETLAFAGVPVSRVLEEETTALQPASLMYQSTELSTRNFHGHVPIS